MNALMRGTCHCRALVQLSQYQWYTNWSRKSISYISNRTVIGVWQPWWKTFVTSYLTSVGPSNSQNYRKLRKCAQWSLRFPIFNSRLLRHFPSSRTETWENTRFSSLQNPVCTITLLSPGPGFWWPKNIVKMINKTT